MRLSFYWDPENFYSRSTRSSVSSTIALDSSRSKTFTHKTWINKFIRIYVRVMTDECFSLLLTVVSTFASLPDYGTVICTIRHTEKRFVYSFDTTKRSRWWKKHWISLVTLDLSHITLWIIIQWILIDFLTWEKDRGFSWNSLIQALVHETKLDYVSNIYYVRLCA